MRYQLYAITLLVILIFNIFRFEIPYIEYAIFKPYIAKNLCVNKDKPRSCCEGKCFREKQVKQVNSTHETETTNSTNSNKIPQTKEIKEFLEDEKNGQHPGISTINQVETVLKIAKNLHQIQQE